MSNAFLSTSEEAIKKLVSEIRCRFKQRSKPHLTSKGKTSHGKKGKTGHAVKGMQLFVFVINIFIHFFKKSVAGISKEGKRHTPSYLVIWVFLQLQTS